MSRGSVKKVVGEGEKIFDLSRISRKLNAFLKFEN